MDLFSTSHPVTTGVDISSQAFWDLPFDERDKSFGQLRATAPVSWHPPVEGSQEHAEAGFWAVTRAEDLTAVERNTEVFQSRYGISLTPTPVEQATAGVFSGQLLTRLPRLELGEPVPLHSNFVNGITALPARVG
jgi:cytochrome P450